jgi:hypothetical protein
MSPNLIAGCASAVVLGSLLVACAPAPTPPPPPAVSTLTRTFGLVDPVGHQAGIMVLEPVGNGVVYDNTGRVIGMVVPPAPN